MFVTILARSKHNFTCQTTKSYTKLDHLWTIFASWILFLPLIFNIYYLFYCPIFQGKNSPYTSLALLWLFTNSIFFFILPCILRGILYSIYANAYWIHFIKISIKLSVKSMRFFTHSILNSFREKWTSLLEKGVVMYLIYSHVYYLLWIVLNTSHQKIHFG